VNAKTYFDCPNALEIGNRVFKNWNKDGEGSMTVVSAIKRSCNTWFYRAALESGADYLSNMALRLGFGERTGIPLKAEGEGFVQTNAWTLQHRGHKMLPGDIANMAIGQGMVLATPLQVCQCMAGLGDGTRIPQPRLVLQIQDMSDRVVMAYEPKDRKRIDLNPDHRQTVINGMVAVVNGGGGTGRSAASSRLRSPARPAPRSGRSRRIRISPGSRAFCRRESRCLPSPSFMKASRVKPSAAARRPRPSCAKFSPTSSRRPRRMIRCCWR
jgi:cell division protein FtsI/penicillin-binding protein 2